MVFNFYSLKIHWRMAVFLSTLFGLSHIEVSAAFQNILFNVCGEKLVQSISKSLHLYRNNGLLLYIKR